MSKDIENRRVGVLPHLFISKKMLKSPSELIIKPYNYDDDLVTEVEKSRKPGAKVYRAPLTAVVLGKGSNPEVELNIDAIEEDGIPILQRHGGGCSVVIDPGNLVISVVLPVEGIKDNRKYFDRITKWLIDKLREAGLNGVQQRGISDLAIGDRKIGGSAIYRTRDILYYSTTLLMTADLSLMDRYLKYPPREPDYRKGRIHLDFVMNVGEIEGLGNGDWGVEGVL